MSLFVRAKILLSLCIVILIMGITPGMLDSGCRASEFVALNVGDVNLRSGAVMVRAGKGDKDRVTRIGERSRRALAAYLAERAGGGSVGSAVGRDDHL